MLVRNKWNKKTYKVIEVKDGKVTLERSNGSQFTIAKAEYFLNYVENNA